MLIHNYDASYALAKVESQNGQLFKNGENIYLFIFVRGIILIQLYIICYNVESKALLVYYSKFNNHNFQQQEWFHNHKIEIKW